MIRFIVVCSFLVCTALAAGPEAKPTPSVDPQSKLKMGEAPTSVSLEPPTVCERYADKLKPIKVKRVVSGSSFTIVYKGKEIKIHLARVDAPVKGQDQYTACVREFEKRLGDKSVSIAPVSKLKYRNARAFVCLGTTDLGEAVLSSGCGWHHQHDWETVPSDVSVRYENVKNIARLDGKGLWHAGTEAVAPWDVESKSKWNITPSPKKARSPAKKSPKEKIRSK